MLLRGAELSGVVAAARGVSFVCGSSFLLLCKVFFAQAQAQASYVAGFPVPLPLLFASVLQAASPLEHGLPRTLLEHTCITEQATAKNK